MSRKRGRRPKLIRDLRDQRVVVLLTRGELDRLHELVAESGVDSVSLWVRQMLSLRDDARPLT